MLCIVSGQIVTWDSEEDMVVDSLHQWAAAVAEENVHFGVGDQAEHASCQSQSKVVANIDHELVFLLELDNQTWTLARMGWYGPVSFGHILHQSL